MSQTETKVIQNSTTQQQPFGFFDLKTVQWIGSVRAVDQVTKYTKDKTTSEQFPLMAYIFATIEMFIIHIYLFIHSLPWPDFMVNIIKRIDHLIENFLEYVNDKLDWWWDVLMVRLIRLRDSIEALIDAFLSVCLFVVYKVIEFWMKVFNLAVEFLKIIFAPAIWIFKAIFPPPEAEKKTTSALKPVNESYPTSSQNGANKPMSEGSTGSTGSAKVNELDEQNRFSPTTSDCDSDVSVVSETWSIGHTDKYGKYYNRMEMKATAEGRLRAAMYKRVKAQLTLMRRNSVSISKGMTSYAVEHLVPRIKPKANALLQRIKALASKYGFDELYDRILREKENHYILSLIFSSILYVTLVPVKLVSKTLIHEKKKSRRTRSMRSESLRRRTGNTGGVVPQTAEPYGLKLSKEPVVNEEAEFNGLKVMKEETDGLILEEKEEGNKLEDDPMRDSALASSIDDIYLLSDSNDGANSLKDQTIHEEESEEHLTPMENGKITSSEEDLRSSNRSDLSSSKEDIDVNKEAKLDEAPPSTKKSLKQRKPPQQPQHQQQIKYQPHSHQQKQPQQKQNQQQQQQQQPQQQDKKSEQNLKPVSANNGETQPSPQTRKKSIIINKDCENQSEDQRKENNGKSPKRKISFSLT